MNCIGEEMGFPEETDTTYDWFLPFLTSHFSPVHGGAHKHENVCLLSSNKQEPPLRHPVMRQPWKEIVRFIKWTIAKIFVPNYMMRAYILRHWCSILKTIRYTRVWTYSNPTGVDENYSASSAICTPFISVHSRACFLAFSLVPE